MAKRRERVELQMFRMVSAMSFMEVEGEEMGRSSTREARRARGPRRDIISFASRAEG